MGMNTAIEYVHHSWNPWTGCQHISDGCSHCYMYAGMKRYGRDPTIVQRTRKATFNAPLNRGSWLSGERVFLCSWSDFFHPDADEHRDEAWEIVRERDDLTFLIVTKRPDFAAARLPADWGDGWPNVWIIATAESQRWLDVRMYWLSKIPAVVRGISYEPALGPIDIAPYAAHIDWVAAGCESGPKRRRAERDWFWSLCDQCAEHDIPFFLKQMDVDGKLTKMPELEGTVWDELPGEVTA